MKTAIDFVLTAMTVVLLLATAIYFNLVLSGVNNPVAVQFFSAYRCPIVGALAVQTINKINAVEDPQSEMAVKRVK